LQKSIFGFFNLGLSLRIGDPIPFWLRQSEQGEHRAP
jgi:hypothetical protein